MKRLSPKEFDKLSHPNIVGAPQYWCVDYTTRTKVRVWPLPLPGVTLYRVTTKQGWERPRVEVK
jgi:Uma2 family endonuclease